MLLIFKRSLVCSRWSHHILAVNPAYVTHLALRASLHPSPIASFHRIRGKETIPHCSQAGAHTRSSLLARPRGKQPTPRLPHPFRSQWKKDLGAGQRGSCADKEGTKRMDASDQQSDATLMHAVQVGNRTAMSV